MRSPVGELAAWSRGLVAKAPIAYTRQTLSGLTMPWRNDATTQMRAVNASGTLFAIVNRISTAVAQVEWHLYRKAASGRKEDRVEVTSHLALDIWNNPNPFYTREEFVETFQQHMELTGEAWWLIGRDSRSTLPLELWPVRPDRMLVNESAQDFVAGYWYREPDSTITPLTLADVIQIAMPNPLDPYRGMGPVQAILVDVDASRYTAEWNRNFFLNSATPGGIIELDRNLTDDEFDQMTSRWREQHQGVWQAHRVAILEQGRWVERRWAQKDMQFKELREQSSDVIREAFGMHKHMIGGSDDVNLANANAAQITFDRHLTLSRLRRIRGKLNNPYLRLFGASEPKRYEFDFDNPVLADGESVDRERDSKAKAFAIYVAAGYERDSVSTVLEIPPMKAAPVAPVPLVLSPPPGTHPEQPAAPTAVASRAFRGAAEHPDLTADELPDVTHAKEALDAALAGLMAHWSGITAEQKTQLVTAVRTIAERGGLDELSGLVVDSAQAAGLLGDAMVALGIVAGHQVVQEAAAQGVDIAAVTPHEVELRAVAVVVAALLGQELAVSAARAAMRANGPAATADHVADAVGEWLDGLSLANAEMQLGGALHGAVNAARIATLLSAPEGALYAQEVNDRNTCKPCRAINGRWLGNISDMDQVEKSYPGGAYGGYVGCQGGARCRGTVVGVWRPDQVAGP